MSRYAVKYRLECRDLIPGKQIRKSANAEVALLTVPRITYGYVADITYTGVVHTEHIQQSGATVAGVDVNMLVQCRKSCPMP